MNEITSIQNIIDLALSGFTDWQKYGHVRVSRNDDLLLFSYTQEAMFEANWNFFERVSRGLIINEKTGEIVARPFDKFFNWFEGGRKSAGHIVTVTEKVDGSLGILYRQNGQYKIATRGGFGSEQAIWATEFLNNNYDLYELPDEFTLIFEIIYPENRIVVDYQGKQDLVLLAVRNRFTGEYLPFYPNVYGIGEFFGFTTPKTYNFNNVVEIIEQTGVIQADQEGWVVEFSDGQRFKFKGDAYLELHKLISNLSYKNTLKAMEAGTANQILDVVPDEFRHEVESWIEEIETVVNSTLAETFRLFEIAPKDTRKEFAIFANQTRYAPYLFALLDGREVTPLIYRNEFKS